MYTCHKRPCRVKNGERAEEMTVTCHTSSLVTCHTCRRTASVRESVRRQSSTCGGSAAEPETRAAAAAAAAADGDVACVKRRLVLLSRRLAVPPPHPAPALSLQLHTSVDDATGCLAELTDPCPSKPPVGRCSRTREDSAAFGSLRMPWLPRRAQAARQGRRCNAVGQKHQRK